MEDISRGNISSQVLPRINHAPWQSPVPRLLPASLRYLGSTIIGHTGLAPDERKGGVMGAAGGDLRLV